MGHKSFQIMLLILFYFIIRKLIELSTDQSLQITFKYDQNNLRKFWLQIQYEYRIFSKREIVTLVYDDLFSRKRIVNNGYYKK